MMEKSDTTKAALWMIGAILSFTSMAIAGRMVSPIHTTFEIMFFRSAVGLFIVVCLAWPLVGHSFVKTDKIKLHVFRNICHFTGQNLWFFALPLIPLAQLFALEFTSPLWVMMLAPIVLGERLTAQKLLIAGLGILGVLMVARPDFGGISIGLVAAAVAAIGFAFTALATRALTRTDGIATIMFYLTLFQLIFAAIALVIAQQVTWPTGDTLPWLALIGCAGLIAHYSMTRALSLAPASIVMPIDFARLPLIAVIGVMFYGEALTPLIILGALIILAANYLNIRQSN